MNRPRWLRSTPGERQTFGFAVGGVTVCRRPRRVFSSVARGGLETKAAVVFCQEEFAGMCAAAPRGANSPPILNVLIRYRTIT